MGSQRTSRYRPAMELTQEQLDEIWKQVEDLDRRAAETDRRLEVLFREIDETIELCKRAERRLAKYL
jgi:hypothetical protein